MVTCGAPYPAEEMKAWKIGRAVGNTRNNDSTLIEPLKEEDPAQLKLIECPGILIGTPDVYRLVTSG